MTKRDSHRHGREEDCKSREKREFYTRNKSRRSKWDNMSNFVQWFKDLRKKAERKSRSHSNPVTISQILKRKVSKRIIRQWKVRREVRRPLRWRVGERHRRKVKTLLRLRVKVRVKAILKKMKMRANKFLPQQKNKNQHNQNLRTLNKSPPLTIAHHRKPHKEIHHDI